MKPNYLLRDSLVCQLYGYIWIYNLSKWAMSCPSPSAMSLEGIVTKSFSLLRLHLSFRVIL